MSGRTGTAAAHADARRAPRVPFALLVGGLLVGGLLLLLALNTASAANELTRHELAVKDQGVANQVQALRNEVALSAAPGNLASAAAALGMVPAANPAFIVVGPDGSATVLGSPKAVTAAPAAAPHPPKPTPATTTPAAPVTPKAPATPATTSTPAAKPATPARTSGTARPGTARTTAPKATPTPTPTPTPVLTLPGGQR